MLITHGTVVAITHDRYFLDNAAGWILELDRGEGIPWEGNYTSWLEQKDARLQQEASQEKARQKTIEKELEWVRQNPKGRQSKSKARMARFEELQSGDRQKRNETNELFIPPGERLGDKVIEVNNLTKSFDGRVLIDDLSFSMPKGAIVGIIGANGAGKSTLFKMLSGTEQPDSGTIELGDTVKLASVDQFRDSMDDTRRFTKRSLKALISSRSTTLKSQLVHTVHALTSKVQRPTEDHRRAIWW